MREYYSITSNKIYDNYYSFDDKIIEEFTFFKVHEHDGIKGSMGYEGSRGLQGSDGDRGDRGEMGDTGDRGERGYQGLEGPMGLKGIDGKKGEKGITGEDGATGPKGNFGLRGNKGDKGDKGDTGNDGRQGAKGDRGDRGDEGYSYTDSHEKIKFKYFNGGTEAPNGHGNSETEMIGFRGPGWTSPRVNPEYHDYYGKINRDKSRVYMAYNVYDQSFENKCGYNSVITGFNWYTSQDMGGIPSYRVAQAIRDSVDEVNHKLPKVVARDLTGVQPSLLENTCAKFSKKKNCEKRSRCEWFNGQCVDLELKNPFSPEYGNSPPIMGEFPPGVPGLGKTQFHAKQTIGLPYNFRVTCGTINNYQLPDDAPLPDDAETTEDDGKILDCNSQSDYYSKPGDSNGYSIQEINESKGEQYCNQFYQRVDEDGNKIPCSFDKAFQSSKSNGEYNHRIKCKVSERDDKYIKSCLEHADYPAECLKRESLTRGGDISVASGFCATKYDKIASDGNPAWCKFRKAELGPQSDRKKKKNLKVFCMSSE